MKKIFVDFNGRFAFVTLYHSTFLIDAGRNLLEVIPAHKDWYDFACGDSIAIWVDSEFNELTAGESPDWMYQLADVIESACYHKGRRI